MPSLSAYCSSTIVLAVVCCFTLAESQGTCAFVRTQVGSRVSSCDAGCTACTYKISIYSGASLNKLPELRKNLHNKAGMLQIQFWKLIDCSDVTKSGNIWQLKVAFFGNF